LLDWKERMDLCLNRLQQAEADSSESRSAKDEIQMALGALRQIMERLQTGKMESSRQTSGEGSASARTVSSSTSTSSSETKTGSALLSEVRPNSRLSRLREELQREESRLNFLRQNSRSLELRARIRPSLPSVQDGQNSGAQEGTSQWEERIKRAAIDETNLLEKISTLKGQIAELRGEVQSASAVAMDTSG
jgi:chromosome segregation ATPase